MALSPDGKTLLTGTDHSARLWDAATGQPLGEPLRHPGSVMAVTFSPDANTIITASDDSALRIWNGGPAHSWQCVRQIQADPAAVAFGPAATTIISGGRGGEILVWEPVSRLRFADISTAVMRPLSAPWC